MSKEAMKLALEALEEITDEVFSPYDNKLGEAITALREALEEQPAKQEPVAWQYRDARDDGTWGAWLGCDKRLAEDEYRQVRALYASPQPAPVQQEPVAVVSGYYGGQCVILPIDPARIFNSNTALYTSPPAQRKPLTDEQIEAIHQSTWIQSTATLNDFARAIEAKLKEKNT